MKELIIVTGNKDKLREAQQILKDFKLTNHALDLPEIQGSPEEIIRLKAREAFKILKKPCFVEDVAFGFKAWNWLPGPYIKDFLKYVGVENLPALLDGKDKTANMVCTIGYATSESNVKIIQGEIFGMIASFKEGNGFGFDKIFIPEGDTRRFSEMSDEEKNSISHRGRALEKFRAFLEND
ncbi:RdgB/HAM1 family non-canonical purine NTP pyrophosphatase [Candidatus Woesearchaeota archaeon]|nr:RdgB/HAM1 family non-canonical purine NTP pyrophosphatase [Candidatus Woesearchaeota archaeon]